MIVIPNFQREFVWDKRKASRFIESLAVGLPVPELFLYQIERNKLWVVDGQQRLMTIYFFRKGRFPRPKEVVAVGRRMRDGDMLPEETWADNSKFSRFSLDLRSPNGGAGDLNGQSYDDLAGRLELKPLRTIVIRQFSPDGFNAAYEIFDRLNTGGVKLSPQQIRMCLFRSPFLEMVDELNPFHSLARFGGIPSEERPKRRANDFARVRDVVRGGRLRAGNGQIPERLLPQDAKHGKVQAG